MLFRHGGRCIICVAGCCSFSGLVCDLLVCFESKVGKNGSNGAEIRLETQLINKAFPFFLVAFKTNDSLRS